VEYYQEYGHPNIPLGSSEGRQCQTLRRLHIQNKLRPDEVDWLTQMGFTFFSLEEVYHTSDFDILFQRMLDYEAEHQLQFQIPKKLPSDPELGAWVTGIRRLGKTGVQPEHCERLERVNFAWVSTRKCGSKFMQQYRSYCESEKTAEELLQDPAAVAWVIAQQRVAEQGNLSVTRLHYMEELFGKSWMDIRTGG